MIGTIAMTRTAIWAPMSRLPFVPTSDWMTIGIVRYFSF